MTETDARLVERAREGDSDAFGALVRRHLGAAYAVALATLREPTDAEDICQDAFVIALERLEECRRPERFVGWLMQIVRNRARDALRRRAVRQAWPLEEAVMRASTSNPAQDTERALLRGRLVAALADLPPVQREVLLLHDLEGYRHREIAGMLELPEGTARSHLFHARRRLRAVLGSEVHMEETDGPGTD